MNNLQVGLPAAQPAARDVVVANLFEVATKNPAFYGDGKEGTRAVWRCIIKGISTVYGHVIKGALAVLGYLIKGVTSVHGEGLGGIRAVWGAFIKAVATVYGHGIEGIRTVWGALNRPIHHDTTYLQVIILAVTVYYIIDKIADKIVNRKRREWNWLERRLFDFSLLLLPICMVKYNLLKTESHNTVSYSTLYIIYIPSVLQAWIYLQVTQTANCP